jgi:hypothetical protein
MFTTQRAEGLPEISENDRYNGSAGTFFPAPPEFMTRMCIGR